ncbi:hypothetical protein PTKU64_30680 [Paraburkholderia terrae]|uniref:Class I SAM-dependent methyltransferase n=1 Tax=Paraburkholderia terrae TaxID=311230 RepID=A0ABN6JEL7_9BURK|nr:class I SAM-dependent methyltransferase [Paraburkholderia terrae]BCZ79393.1 hypothetical protein PTKU64_30680 [Paraburkholderia terrae]
MDNLNERSRSPIFPCKVCHHDSHLYGVVDFNKNCEESKGFYLPLSGVPIYYHQCSHCGLVFTAAFDHWSKEDFGRYIYNDGYGQVDPEYSDKRPRENADLVSRFCGQRTSLKVLDYGGGNGALARHMNAKGFDAQSWDPMQENAVHHRPVHAQYDVVTAFEVMEHSPTPVETLADGTSFLKEQGVFLFSTWTIDDLPPRSSNFHYFAPRNGHVTVHTRKSLTILAARCRLKVHHFGPGQHLIYGSLPSWLPR